MGDAEVHSVSVGLGLCDEDAEGQRDTVGELEGGREPVTVALTQPVADGVGERVSDKEGVKEAVKQAEAV